jgi:hypothetical protein
VLVLPRYLKDLPPGLNRFNDSCLATHRGNATAMQKNTDHVRKIVQEAKVCPFTRSSANGALATESCDIEELDDFMEGDGSMEYQGSF